jgi:small GTP-binding protein
MNVVTKVRSLLLGGDSSGVLSPEHRAEIVKALEGELARPPRIAVVGETGVGKSTTINALFNSGLEMSHAKACTQNEIEIEVEAAGGLLRIVDLPGLGEDLDADKRHMETYARVLPEVDLVLWILKADNRAMTHIQAVARRLARAKHLDPKRLVLAINQVDLLQPGAWDASIGLPSVEQEETIRLRRDDVAQKMRQALRKLPEEQIVAYSALRRHNLEALLEALVRACGEQRRWVLAQRARVADFNELIPAMNTANNQETKS